MPDPAAGKFEMPGGHMEAGESPRQAAVREWQEETGLRFPDGEFTGTWTSANGIYQGFAYTIAREADLDIFARQIGSDPDGDVDGTETIAWWDPATLAGNPAVRPELAASLGDVLPLLGCGTGDPVQGDEATCPCGTPVAYDEMNGWQHADGSVSHEDGESVSDKMAAVAKAAVLPKDRARAAKAAAPSWPGWKLDLATASYWSPRVTTAAQQALSREQLDAIASAYVSDHPGQDGTATGKRERNAAALAWLTARGTTVPMDSVAPGITADSVLIGGASAEAATAGKADADTGGWKPGDTATAAKRAGELGLAALLLSGHGGEGGGDVPDVAGSMGDGYLNVVSRVLAGWDPDVAADELGSMLADAVADGAYATTLTATQIEVMVGQAALQWYTANGVPLLQWYAGPGACQICLANAAAAPRPPGVLWPGGVAEPLQHPSCGCWLGPPQS